MRKGHNYFIFIILLAFSLVPLGGCGDDGGPSGPSTPPQPMNVSGTVSKSVVSGAAVTIHNFTAGGGMGAQVAGPFNTDSQGAWSGQLPAGVTGTFLVMATGGSYTDEATANTVSVTSPMYGILATANAPIGMVTPLTHAAVVNAQARISNGETLAAALNASVTGLQNAFGFNPMTTSPVIPLPRGNNAGLSDEYAVFLAGLSELVNTALTTAVDLFASALAIALDMTDGVLDGVDANGNQIQIDLGSGLENMPVLDADDISALIDAANQWASNNGLTTVLSVPDLDDFADVDPGGGGALFCPGTPGGSLAVTGSDAVLLGNSFTPNTATAQCLGGIPISLVLSEGETEVLTLVVDASSIGLGTMVAPGAGWTSVINTGVIVSQNGNVSTIEFINQTMNNVQTQGTIILNGTVTYTQTQ